MRHAQAAATIIANAVVAAVAEQHVSDALVLVLGVRDPIRLCAALVCLAALEAATLPVALGQPPHLVCTLLRQADLVVLDTTLTLTLDSRTLLVLVPEQVLVVSHEKRSAGATADDAHAQTVRVRLVAGGEPVRQAIPVRRWS